MRNQKSDPDKGYLQRYSSRACLLLLLILTTSALVHAGYGSSFSRNLVSAARVPVVVNDSAGTFNSQLDIRNHLQPEANYSTNTFMIEAESGLVAAWGFNEGGGTTAFDSSGNDQTGTLSGPSWTASGKYGNALSFNGTDNYVNVPDSNVLDLTAGMTLSAWVNPTVLAGAWQNVIIKERAGAEVYSLYSENNTTAPVVFVVRQDAQDSPVMVDGSSVIPLNSWTHLAATHDSTTLRLYVNGVQVGAQSASGALLTSTGAFRIGGNSIWGEYFQGLIDEVRVYNRALSQSEIQSDMNTAIGGTPTPIPEPTPTPTPDPVAGPMVTRFELRDAYNNVSLLFDGMQLIVGSLAEPLVISAITNPSVVGSVRVQLGSIDDHIENAAPYTINAFTLSQLGTGTHQLRATPYTLSNLGGTQGTPLALSIQVINSIPTPTPTPAPTATPPVISGVSSSGVTSSAALISWTTNEASNTQVDYGTTTSYGSTTSLNTSMVTSHLASLSGLAASTLYHYRVKSRNAAGNLATSADFTFTTLTGGASSAGDFFVATTGNDSSPGTQSQPFRTIARGIQAMSAGKTLIINGGTYGEPIVAGTIPAGTSWSAPTSIKANVGQTVIIRPTTSQNPYRVADFGSGQQYIVLDGLTLDAINCRQEGAKMSGANHIRFLNCEIMNTKTMGILTSPGAASGFNEIINCHLHNIGTSTQLDHAIYLSSPGNVVSGSRIHDVTSHGIHLYTTSPGMNNNTFRNNIIYNCKRGIGLYGGTNNQIYNNVIYNVVDIGIYLRNDAGDLGAALLFNNSINSNGQYGIKIDDNSASGTTQVRNNIAFGSSVNNVENGGSGVVLSNNLTTNPIFVDAASGNLAVQAGSPAINAGMTLTQVTTDINGTARPVGGAYDIGAYER